MTALEEITGQSCIGTISTFLKIGIRIAGSEGERKAADQIASRFRDLGLVRVRLQEFPCLTFGHSKCLVTVWQGGRWKSIRSEPAAHSPSTSGGSVEGELVVLEDVPQSRRQCREGIAGKVVLMYASLLFDRSRLKRIMDAGPLAILLVDERFHGDWTVAVGFPRYWIDFLVCPVVNISYLDAWKLVSGGAVAARIRLDSFLAKAVSQNVIGEIRGRELPGEFIVVSAHHDSVANNPGADDNLSGVAALLELARFFSERPPRRTLQFISYGTEEQLSEGARHFAFSLKDPGRAVFALNVDAIGAWMGQTSVIITGPKELAGFVRKVNRQTAFPGQVKSDVNPFSDHFPLNLRGVPSAWYYRQTFAAARHFHHSSLETIEVLSPKVLEATVRNQAVLLDHLSNVPQLPFRRELPRTQWRKLKKLAGDWVGLDPDQLP